ncbi:MAG: hypothetical protein Kow00117_16010 [Phototrophicales bacterium]
MSWDEFRQQLDATCLIIGAILNVRCFVSVFPDTPFPGDKAGISITAPEQNGAYFEFDLYALRDSARRIDVFDILQREIITAYQTRNTP